MPLDGTDAEDPDPPAVKPKFKKRVRTFFKDKYGDPEG